MRNGGWIRAKRPSAAILIVPGSNHHRNSHHVMYTEVTLTQIFLRSIRWLLRAGKVHDKYMETSLVSARSCLTRSFSISTTQRSTYEC